MKPQLQKRAQAIVLQALHFGTDVPAGMKPLIKSLIKRGKLVDADGKVLTKIPRKARAVSVWPEPSGPTVPPPPLKPDGKPARKHPGGRPSKFTPDRIARIMQAAVVAVGQELIARYAGINYQTLRNWLLRGEAAQQRRDAGKMVKVEDRAYLEFFEDFTRARAEAEVNALAQIKLHGKKDYRALVQHLIWTDPATYAPRTRIEHTGAGGGPIQTEQITEEDRQKRLQRVARLYKQRKE